MAKAPKRLLVHLGTPEEAERRESALRKMAAEAGLTTRRGENGEEIGNISALIQTIADDYENETLPHRKDNDGYLGT